MMKRHRFFRCVMAWCSNKESHCNWCGEDASHPNHGDDAPFIKEKPATNATNPPREAA